MLRVDAPSGASVFFKNIILTMGADEGLPLESRASSDHVWPTNVQGTLGADGGLPLALRASLNQEHLRNAQFQWGAPS